MIYTGVGIGPREPWVWIRDNQPADIGHATCLDNEHSSFPSQWPTGFRFNTIMSSRHCPPTLLWASALWAEKVRFPRSALCDGTQPLEPLKLASLDLDESGGWNSQVTLQWNWTISNRPQFIAIYSTKASASFESLAFFYFALTSCCLPHSATNCFFQIVFQSKVLCVLHQLCDFK